MNPHRNYLRDIDVIDFMARPDQFGLFSENERALVRLDISWRGYWHALYDPCPCLLELSGDQDGFSIFRPFMKWGSERKISFDWPLHLWVIVWLKENKKLTYSNSDVILSELAAAAAARWAISDRTAALGIAIYRGIKGNWTVGWKCRAVDLPREIQEIEIGENLDPEGDIPSHFIIYDSEISRFPGWSAIP